MDFEPTYTEEQEQFRSEVREWLKDNMPSGIEHPPDPADLTYEQYQKRRDLGRKLGAKGWLWPTAPQEYGGGGLSLDHSVIIEEEIDSFGLTIPPYYDSGGKLGGASVLVSLRPARRRCCAPCARRNHVTFCAMSRNVQQSHTHGPPINEVLRPSHGAEVGGGFDGRSRRAGV